MQFNAEKLEDLGARVGGTVDVVVGYLLRKLAARAREQETEHKERVSRRPEQFQRSSGRRACEQPEWKARQ
jgi:hypothetical protein